MRVLLVEDHLPLADAVCDALQRAGFAVDHAVTAAAARELVRLADHALVLLDLGLPDGDGMRPFARVASGRAGAGHHADRARPVGHCGAGWLPRARYNRADRQCA